MEAALLVFQNADPRVLERVIHRRLPCVKGGRCLDPQGSGRRLLDEVWMRHGRTGP